MEKLLNSYAIKDYCHIKEGKLSRKGKLIFQSEEDVFKEFSKELYKKLEIKHSKFFKMDDLSKLAFLGSEVLLNDYSSSEEKNIALVFSNKASSLTTDRKHQETIKNKESFYPSPANFVYTLPNICLGEISIRHKLYSENSFFIFDAYNPEYLAAYASNLMANKKADEVLCAWVDIDEDFYEAFFYMVSLTGILPHNIDNLIKLY